MASEAKQVLDATADLEQLSFYGLSHWLGEVSKLLDRVDDALLAKAPSAEEKELTQHKEELIDAQARLRRAMGARLDGAALTKRERPLAEEFLRQQMNKLKKAATGPAAEKATRAVDKMSQIMEDVRKKPPAPETKEVQEMDASMKAAEAEWKEVSPIYDKWEKGKHSFKTNADLQALKRRYENCKKTLDSGPERLQKALCSTREGKALSVPQQERGPPKGWLAAASTKKAAPVQGRAKQAVRRPAAQNAWGSSAISFAQRLRAQVSAQVREDALAAEDEGQEDNEDEDADEVEENATVPEVTSVPAVRPKAPPRLPGNAAAASPPPKAAPVDEEDEDEAEEEENNSKQQSYAASAKKKGQNKKKKRGNRDDVNVAEPAASPPLVRPSAAEWVSNAEAAISGSVLQNLLRPSAWSLPESEAIADEQVEDLAMRLPWSSPMGLVLPLEWKEFLSLEIDGGPRRTSKRGAPAWVTRVQKNAASFLAHYVTLVFILTLLHALSHFGLLLWALVAQAGLILAPPNTPYLRSPPRVLLLQGAHLILWLLFVRSLWQMHFFVKVLNVLLVAGHAYVVTPLDEHES